MKRVVLTGLLTLALVQPLRAQESADDAKKAAVLEEARQHVAKAKVHYDLGEFKEAADEYIIVYRLRPIPALLFNIAQAYRQGGLYDKARSFYKSYLREVPDAKNKAVIEQAIREMDELLAKERKTREAPPKGVKGAAEASLPVPEKTPAGKATTPATVAGATKAPEPAKPTEAKPATATVAKPAGTTAAAGSTSAGSAAAGSTTPAVKPPVTVAVATPRPSVPAGATPGTQVPHPAVESEGGILTRWWFWTAVGAVAIGVGAAALTMGGNSAPSSHFGTNGI